MKKFFVPCVIVMMAALLGFGAVFVLNFVNRGTDGGRGNLAMADFALHDFVENLPPIRAEDDFGDALQPQAQASPKAHEAVIFPSTLMIYEFYSAETGDYRRVLEAPPQTLLGKTAEELSTMFVDWQIVSFDSTRVVLRQNPAVEHRNYIIGVHEGYIAVFYDTENYAIKELTNRPISALSEDEQIRLKEGIRVVGNEELMRALEDFSS